MPRFLSDEWIADLDAAAARSEALDGILADSVLEELVVEHVVTDLPEARTAEAAFHLVLGAGPARVRAGRAAAPTVSFTQTYATARNIASGAASAQAAFMSGALRLGGRVDLLLAHHTVLVGVDDVFADIRARTDWST